MMNETLANPGPEERIGLALETMMTLSPAARALYDKIYDYCTYSSDPQYQTLHKFRTQIMRIANTGDREILINYFNHDPAIRWNGMSKEPWEYYKDPY